MALFDEGWNYCIEIYDCDKDYNDFEHKIKAIDVQIVDLLDCSLFNKFNINTTKALNVDLDLKSLVDKNTNLKEEINVKSLELKTFQTQYENHKKDRIILSQEVKDTHEALLMAKKYYKKHLKLYYTIDLVQDNKQKIFIQFFTESKKTSYNYSAWLLRDMKTGCYELEDTTPRLSTFKAIQRKLKDTNDIPGALSCIRQSFLKIKQSK